MVGLVPPTKSHVPVVYDIIAKPKGRGKKGSTALNAQLMILAMKIIDR